jgi:hypothetical protein
MSKVLPQVDPEMSWIEAAYCGSRNGTGELDDFVGAGPVVHTESEWAGLGGGTEARTPVPDVDPSEFVAPKARRPRRPPPLEPRRRTPQPRHRARVKVREEAAAFYGGLPQAIRADPDFDPAVAAWITGDHDEYARRRGAVKARTGATPAELSAELARARYGDPAPSPQPS